MWLATGWNSRSRTLQLGRCRRDPYRHVHDVAAHGKFSKLPHHLRAPLSIRKLKANRSPQRYLPIPT